MFLSEIAVVEFMFFTFEFANKMPEQTHKPTIFTAHALQRMRERGTNENDVREAIRIGMREPARRGLFLYRLNMEFKREWDGRYYGVQQVAPIVAEEKERFVVITVYTFYFQEGEKR